MKPKKSATDKFFERVILSGYTREDFANLMDYGYCATWCGSMINFRGIGGHNTRYSKRKVPYGIFQERTAHSWAYRKYVGAVPKGMQVHHKCRNPACVLPSHLELKTQLEHAKDHIVLGPQKMRASTPCQPKRRYKTKKAA